MLRVAGYRLADGSSAGGVAAASWGAALASLAPRPESVQRPEPAPSAAAPAMPPITVRRRAKKTPSGVAADSAISQPFLRLIGMSLESFQNGVILDVDRSPGKSISGEPCHRP